MNGVDNSFAIVSKYEFSFTNIVESKWTFGTICFGQIEA